LDVAGFRRFFEDWQFGPFDPRLHEYAEYAYESCVAWFGIPSDKHWSYEIVKAPKRASAVKSLLHRRYILYIPSE